MPKEELYFSTDIEADGPIPGDNSMLSIGTVVFDSLGNELGDFTENLWPIDGAKEDPETMKWWKTQPEAWKAARANARNAWHVMDRYVQWVESFDALRTFVAYPAGFDFTFVYWYCHHCVGRCPFGFQAIDMKSYSMALLGTKFKETTKRNMPKNWFPETKHSHVAVEDAREQGLLFINQMKARKELINA